MLPSNFLTERKPGFPNASAFYVMQGLLLCRSSHVLLSHFMWRVLLPDPCQILSLISLFTCHNTVFAITSCRLSRFPHLSVHGKPFRYHRCLLLADVTIESSLYCNVFGASLFQFSLRMEEGGTSYNNLTFHLLPHKVFCISFDITVVLNDLLTFFVHKILCCLNTFTRCYNVKRTGKLLYLNHFATFSVAQLRFTAFTVSLKRSECARQLLSYQFFAVFSSGCRTAQ